MKKINNKKKVIILVGIIIILIGIISAKLLWTGKAISSGDGQPVKIVPLSDEERQKAAQLLLTSDFIKDVPDKSPIALSFFSFDNGERVWRDSFLIGKDKLLSEGTPVVYLSLPADYISKFNGNNLCEVIQTASANGDLGFQSDYNAATLFIKYAGLLKYRDCFGF